MAAHPQPRRLVLLTPLLPRAAPAGHLHRHKPARQPLGDRGDRRLFNRGAQASTATWITDNISTTTSRRLRGKGVARARRRPHAPRPRAAAAAPSCDERPSETPLGIRERSTSPRPARDRSPGARALAASRHSRAQAPSSRRAAAILAVRGDAKAARALVSAGVVMRIDERKLRLTRHSIKRKCTLKPTTVGGPTAAATPRTSHLSSAEDRFTSVRLLR